MIMFLKLVHKLVLAIFLQQCFQRGGRSRRVVMPQCVCVCSAGYFKVLPVTKSGQ